MPPQMIAPPDIANAAGTCGWLVYTPEQVKPALNAAFAHPGPALIDVAVARQELSLPPNEDDAELFGTCAHVPDEVFAAVLDSLQVIPEGSSNPMRAMLVMAREGWRFCPCFPEGMTLSMARIFDLVQTNFANSLALSALLNRAVSGREVEGCREACPALWGQRIRRTETRGPNSLSANPGIATEAMWSRRMGLCLN